MGCDQDAATVILTKMCGLIFNPAVDGATAAMSVAVAACGKNTIIMFSPKL